MIASCRFLFAAVYDHIIDFKHGIFVPFRVIFFHFITLFSKFHMVFSKKIQKILYRKGYFLCFHD